MSQKSLEGDRHNSLSRSSSTSSTSSSSSSSSSSPPHRRRKCQRRANRTKSRSRSRSQSSSGSSRSQSVSRSRSRSRERYAPNKHSTRTEAKADAENETQERPTQAITNRDLSSDTSPDRQHVDDSIRSDKCSKTTTNGGLVQSTGTLSQGLDTLADKRVCTTSAGKVANPVSKVVNASSRLKGIQFGKPGTVVRPGIQMKLGQPQQPAVKTKKITVASAFNNDSDEEVEEMPPECKMRMRNIGRDTPTSSGPNSFGKTKQGFIDSKKLFEKSLREAALE